MKRSYIGVMQLSTVCCTACGYSESIYCKCTDCGWNFCKPCLDKMILQYDTIRDPFLVKTLEIYNKSTFYNVFCFKCYVNMNSKRYE